MPNKINSNEIVWNTEPIEAEHIVWDDEQKQQPVESAFTPITQKGGITSHPYKMSEKQYANVNERRKQKFEGKQPFIKEVGRSAKQQLMEISGAINKGFATQLDTGIEKVVFGEHSKEIKEMLPKSVTDVLTLKPLTDKVIEKLNQNADLAQYALAQPEYQNFQGMERFDGYVWEDKNWLNPEYLTIQAVDQGIIMAGAILSNMGAGSAGSFAFMSALETGFALKDLENMKTELEAEGVAVSDEEIKEISLGVGVINGLLELASGSPEIAQTLMRKNGGQTGIKFIKDAIKNGKKKEILKAVNNLSKKIGKTSTLEGATEALQEFTLEVGKVKVGDKTMVESLVEPLSNPESIKQMAQSGLIGFGMGLGGAVSSEATTAIRQQNTISEFETRLTNISQHFTDNNIFEAGQELDAISEAIKNNPDEFETLFKSEKGRTIVEKLTEADEAYAEAKKNLPKALQTVLEAKEKRAEEKAEAQEEVEIVTEEDEQIQETAYTEAEKGLSKLEKVALDSEKKLAEEKVKEAEKASKEEIAESVEVDLSLYTAKKITGSKKTRYTKEIDNETIHTLIKDENGKTVKESTIKKMKIKHEDNLIVEYKIYYDENGELKRVTAEGVEFTNSIGYLKADNKEGRRKFTIEDGTDEILERLDPDGERVVLEGKKEVAKAEKVSKEEVAEEVIEEEVTSEENAIKNFRRVHKEMGKDDFDEMTLDKDTIFGIRQDGTNITLENITDAERKQLIKRDQNKIKSLSTQKEFDNSYINAYRIARDRLILLEEKEVADEKPKETPKPKASDVVAEEGKAEKEGKLKEPSEYQDINSFKKDLSKEQLEEVDEYDEWKGTKTQAKHIFRMLKEKHKNNMSEMRKDLSSILNQNKTKPDQAKVMWDEFDKYFKVKKAEKAEKKIEEELLKKGIDKLNADEYVKYRDTHGTVFAGVKALLIENVDETLSDETINKIIKEADFSSSIPAGGNLANLKKAYKNQTSQIGKKQQTVSKKEKVQKDYKAVGNVYNIPISDINIDLPKFQGRTEAFSQKTVDSIVKNFVPADMDAIVVWKNPKDNKIYVLKGHSRLEGHKQIGKETIDAKFFEGTETEAITFGKESNYKADLQVEVDDAKYIRDDLMKKLTNKTKLREKLRELFGKNAVYLEEIASLNPQGKIFTALVSFRKTTDKSESETIRAIGSWIGHIRKTFGDKITNLQEDELFTLLMDGKAKTSIGSKVVLQQRIGAIVDDAFYDNTKPFNLYKIRHKNNGEVYYNEKHDSLKQEIKDIDDKVAEYKNARSLTKKQSEIDFYNKKIKPLEEARKYIQTELMKLEQNKRKIIGRGISEPNLFEVFDNITPEESNAWEEETGTGIEEVREHENNKRDKEDSRKDVRKADDRKRDKKESERSKKVQEKEVEKPTKKSFREATKTENAWNKTVRWNGYNIATVMWHNKGWKIIPDGVDRKTVENRSYEPIVAFRTQEQLWEYLKKDMDKPKTLKVIRGNKEYELDINEKPYTVDKDDIIYEDKNIKAYVVYQGADMTYAIWDKNAKKNTHHFGLKKALDRELKNINKPTKPTKQSKVSLVQVETDINNFRNAIKNGRTSSFSEPLLEQMLIEAYRKDGITPTTSEYYAQLKKIYGKVLPIKERKARYDAVFGAKYRTVKGELVALHNLSIDNLKNVMKLGGLPAPSLAITKKTIPFEGFGEITLMGDEGMIDPSYYDTKVFASDVYSPRYPSIVYDVDYKEYNKKIIPLINKYKEKVGTTGYELDQSEIKTKGMRDLYRSSVLQYAYLKSIGKTPRTVVREASIGYIRNHPELLKWKTKNGYTDSQSLMRNPDFKKIIKNIMIEEGRKVDANFNSDMFSDNDVENVAYRTAQDLEYYKGKREVDTYAMQDKLHKMTEKDIGYQKWVDNLFEDVIYNEKIYKGFTNSGYRKYAQHTLDNVTDILIKNVRAGEGFNYGSASVRASVTPEFKTVQQIRDSKNELVTRDEFNELKDELNDGLIELANKFKRNYKYDSDRFGYYDSFAEVLIEGGKKGINKGLAREIRKDFDNMDNEDIQEIRDYLIKLRNLPTAYYEAKIKRSVDISEFKGAVVPKTTPQAQIDFLRNKGLQVEVYGKKEGDRQVAIRRIARQQKINFRITDFYSQLERTVTAKFPAKMSAQSVKNWLKKHQVKPVEMDWLGLDEFLEGKKSVTKQELLELVAMNQLTLEEVELGVLKDVQKAIDKRKDYTAKLVKKYGIDFHLEASKSELSEWGELQQEVENVLDSHGLDPTDETSSDMTQTKFSQPNLNLPGGTNYREYFLTAPNLENLTNRTNKTIDELRDRERIAYKKVEKYSKDNNLQVATINSTAIGKKLYSDWKKAHKSWSNAEDKRTPSIDWQDGHGDYSDIVNPVIRLRMDDRKITSQSDLDSMFQKKMINENNYNILTEAMKDKGFVKILFLQEAQPPTEENFAKMPKFLQENAYRLGVKKAIQMAVEGGYDSISWTTGKQQQERYKNLIKQIDNIVSTQYDDGTYAIRATKNNQEVLSESNIEAKDLGKYVGKNIAKKIINKENSMQGDKIRYEQQGIINQSHFKNLELEIGLEYIASIYDEIIPNFIKKYTKKWGGKVESVEMDMGKITGESEITDKVYVKLDEIYEGEEYWKVIHSSGSEYYTANSKEDAIDWAIDEGSYYVYETKEDMENNQNSLNEKDIDIITQKSLTITPQMKEGVAKGQELFKESTRKTKPLNREQRRRYERDLNKMLKKLFGTNAPKIRFVDSIKTIEGKQALGKYQGGFIDIVTGRGNPTDTFLHESVHKAIAEFLTSEEQQVLKDTGKSEEEIAEFVIEYAKARALNKATPTGIKAKAREVVSKLVKILKRLFGGQRQIDSLYDFYDALLGGEFAKRQGRLDGDVSLEPSMRKAWHGTPYIFNKFGMKYIGTGEGAQAFGHGIYFTEKKGIAEFYAEKLTDIQRVVEGLRINGNKLNTNNNIEESIVRYIFAGHILKKSKLVKGLKKKKENAIDENKEYFSEMLKIANKIDFTSTKQIYEVDIWEDGKEDLISWDNPINNKQKKKIIDGLYDKLPTAQTKIQNDKLRSQIKSVKDSFKLSGRETYLEISDIIGSQKGASEFLNSIGIDGIQYKAEGGKSEANNYVVFDENAIDIVSRTAYREDQTIKDLADTAGITIAEAKRQYESVKLVKDKNGNLLAPNGKKSNLNEHQWRTVRTEAFRNWFGDSKVVDENGEPLVVYHGTSKLFNVFKLPTKKQRIKSPLGRLGFYFTESPKLAGDFTKYSWSSDTSKHKVKANIIPVYISMSNPYNMGIDEFISMSNDDVKNIDKRQQEIKGYGYDGIVVIKPTESIWKNSSVMAEFPSNQYIAFHPTQIKSIYNVGTFDPANPDIRYREGKSIKELVEERKERLEKKEKGIKEKIAKEKTITPRNKETKFKYTLLKDKIRDIKQGHRLGELDTKESIKSIQTEIVNYAKANMPLDEAGKRDIGKLLTSVKNTQNIEKLEGIFSEIDNMTTQINKAVNIRKIDKLLKASKTKKVHGKKKATTHPDIDKALKIIRKVRKLRGTSLESYINNLDTQDAETIALFSEFGSLRTRTAEEVETAKQKLTDMVQDGKLWYKEEIEKRKTKMKEIRDKVIDKMTAGKGLRTVRELKAANQIVKNWFVKDFVNSNQSFEWIMDIISKDKTERTGEGYMQTLFGDILNKATNAESKGIREKMEEVTNKAEEIFGKKKLSQTLADNTVEVKKSGVTYVNKAGKRVVMSISQNQAYKKWMELQVPELQATFDKMGFDEITVKEIENFMTPEVRKWAEWQLEFYEQYWDSINEVYRQEYFTNMDKNKNYSPLTREVSEMGDNEDNLLNPKKIIAGVGNQSLSSRVPNTNELAFVDGDTVLSKHIAQMEHFKAWAEPIRTLRSVFGARNVQHILKYEYGTRLKSIINNQINDFARGGIDRALTISFLDKLRRNFVVGELGLNFTTYPKQLVSIFTYLMDIPVSSFTKGLADLAVHPNKIKKFFNENSELIKSRYKIGWNPEIESTLKKSTVGNLAGTRNKMEQFRNLVLFATKMGDKFAIVGGWTVYKHHYDLQIKKGVSEKKAKEYALNKFERVVSRSQQSAQLKDYSQLQKGTIGKLFTMFHNSQQQYFRYEMGALRNLVKGRGSVAHNMKILAVTHFLLPMMFQYIASLFTDDDEETENKKMIRAGILGSWNGLLIAGDMIEFGLEKMFGEKWGYDATPLTSPIKNIGYGINYLMKKDNIGQIKTENLLKSVDKFAHAGGQLLGYPYRPVKKLISGKKAPESETKETRSFFRKYRKEHKDLRKEARVNEYSNAKFERKREKIDKEYSKKLDKLNKKYNTSYKL
jgi:hypothetical protein